MSLNLFVTAIVNLTNIYDLTLLDSNYVTNHEYVCFLQQAHVRDGIHVGAATFHRGKAAYAALNASVTTSKKKWLGEVSPVSIAFKDAQLIGISIGIAN